MASRPKTLQQQSVTARAVPSHPGNLQLAAEAQPKLQHAAEILAIPPTSSKRFVQPPTLRTASANYQQPQPITQPAAVSLQSATFQRNTRYLGNSARKFWDFGNILNVVHGRVKPANIFLSEYVKLHKQCDKGAEKYVACQACTASIHKFLYSRVYENLL